MVSGCLSSSSGIPVSPKRSVGTVAKHQLHVAPDAEVIGLELNIALLVRHKNSLHSKTGNLQEYPESPYPSTHFTPLILPVAKLTKHLLLLAYRLREVVSTLSQPRQTPKAVLWR